MDAELQEWLALAVVALVAGAYLFHRRRRKAGSCGDCASASPRPKETVVRFYRRAPSRDDSPRRDRGPPL
jgi:LPXTG-motif cell wall-anchored protein